MPLAEQAYIAIQDMKSDIEVIALDRRMAALVLSCIHLSLTYFSLMGAVGGLGILLQGLSLNLKPGSLKTREWTGFDWT